MCRLDFSDSVVHTYLLKLFGLKYGTHELSVHLCHRPSRYIMYLLLYLQFDFSFSWM